MSSSKHSLRKIGTKDIAGLATLLSEDQLRNVYLRSELRLGLGGGAWWGVTDGKQLRAAMIAGPLIVPWVPEPSDVPLLARPLLEGGKPRMMVGDMTQVMALHDAVKSRWPGREIRRPQHVMAVDAQTLRPVEPTTSLRPGKRADLDALTITAAAMYSEEIGTDPLAVDADGWRLRMTHLVDRGWSWLCIKEGQIAFKAELSAWTPQVAQIQGVYTAPPFRRQGLAKSAMAQLCAELLAGTERVCLYVNDYNAAAISLYEQLGFVRCAEFATVLY